MSIRFDTSGEGYTLAITGIGNTAFTFCGWARIMAVDNYGILIGLNSQSNWADVYLNWGNDTDSTSMVIGSYKTGSGGGDYQALFASRPAVGDDFFFYVRSGGSGLQAGWRRPSDSDWVTATCGSVSWSGATPTFRVNTDAFGGWGNRRQGALYLYDSALSDAELLSQMGQLSPVITAWGYYPFNDALLSNNALDQSGNGRDLTSSGTLTVEQNIPEEDPDTVSGSLSAIDGADNISIAGTVAVTGSLSNIDGADNATISGDIYVIGNFSVTDLADDAQLSGTIEFNQITGSIGIVEGADVGEFSGKVINLIRYKESKKSLKEKITTLLNNWESVSGGSQGIVTFGDARYRINLIATEVDLPLLGPKDEDTEILTKLNALFAQPIP